jgi:hypothetical protein
LSQLAHTHHLPSHSPDIFLLLSALGTSTTTDPVGDVRGVVAPEAGTSAVVAFEVGSLGAVATGAVTTTQSRKVAIVTFVGRSQKTSWSVSRSSSDSIGRETGIKLHLHSNTELWLRSGVARWAQDRGRDTVHLAWRHHGHVICTREAHGTTWLGGACPPPHLSLRGGSVSSCVWVILCDVFSGSEE